MRELFAEGVTGRGRRFRSVAEARPRANLERRLCSARPRWAPVPIRCSIAICGASPCRVRRVENRIVTADLLVGGHDLALAIRTRIVEMQADERVTPGCRACRSVQRSPNTVRPPYPSNSSKPLTASTSSRHVDGVAIQVGRVVVSVFMSPCHGGADSSILQVETGLAERGPARIEYLPASTSAGAIARDAVAEPHTSAGHEVARTREAQVPGNKLRMRDAVPV